LIVSVFARPGHALDQEVPACQQADEDALEHLVLPGDDALDLEDGALDRIAVGAGVDGFQMGWIGHSATPWSVGRTRMTKGCDGF
jgi:hypothetical protein